MHTTRRIIWHLAVLLILAFPTLATCAPAVAACKSMGQTAAPHTCCVTHPADCACPASEGKAARNASGSGSYQTRGCSCAIHPAPDSAPASQTPVFVSFLAILIPVPELIASVVMRRGPPIACAFQPSSQSAAYSSTSPRAPPFQG